MRVPVKIKADDPMFIPHYKYEDDAAADLVANLPAGPVVLAAGGKVIVDCGIAIELPVGWEAQIRCRSGLAAKHGIQVTNGVGTIDRGYSGKICVILNNIGKENYEINHGDRIAQLVLKPVYYFDWQPVDNLTETVRNTGGFGSSGV